MTNNIITIHINFFTNFFTPNFISSKYSVIKLLRIVNKLKNNRSNFERNIDSVNSSMSTSGINLVIENNSDILSTRFDVVNIFAHFDNSVATCFKKQNKQDFVGSI